MSIAAHKSCTVRLLLGARMTESALLKLMQARIQNAPRTEYFAFRFADTANEICFHKHMRREGCPLLRRVQRVVAPFIDAARRGDRIVTDDLHHMLNFFAESYYVLQMNAMCLDQVLYWRGTELD